MKSLPSMVNLDLDEVHPTHPSTYDCQFIPMILNLGIYCNADELLGVPGGDQGGGEEGEPLQAEEEQEGQTHRCSIYIYNVMGIVMK